MKKAWVYGLAAMLGLGVSTVIGNQALTFAASTPPVAVQASAPSCSSTQPKEDSVKTTQDATEKTTDDQQPVITVADTDETTDSKENSKSSVVTSDSQDDKKSSTSTEAISGVSVPSSKVSETSADKPSKVSEKTVSSTPTIKTEQEVNSLASQSVTKPTAEEQKEQAVVAAAQAATHEHDKGGQSLPVVSSGINHFATPTSKQKHPRNAVELIWQALIDTFSQRQQCPSDVSDRLVVHEPTDDQGIVKTSLALMTKELHKAFSVKSLAQSFQKDILTLANRTIKDVIGLLNQVLLKDLINTDYR
ncbi:MULTISPECIES: hypothetical protein [Lacticaseibacillus]|uniref:FliK family flagellar hook-length control protein n=1 Tax=Lacticaseibacillus casei DSM 20011 = JCM 1134 = ATCC 393 TaxID=1423732 RepID=A0AAD1ANZ1_LACCA|nr:hypothetical protein [Lacticaseibacillus casei]MBI6598718.1 hypothetical protein [Lacticaseibacillus casei]MBO1482371.1 hypothetical protein [Lacticaseibacillus casei]MBO2417624.1 hypothetical protein [Lacticaseibacillus casei]MCK2082029.1 hypothetical protein [Lacticaseibacillus casei]MDZ5494948.1 hypothetical protein [Lacticaseibacillus casei]